MFILKTPYIANFNYVILCSIFYFCSYSFSFAQIEEYSGWTYNLSAGVDLSGVILINPRSGAGNSQIGIGGSIGGSSFYKNARLHWLNDASINYGIQKVGFGVESTLQKSVDQIRLSSKLGYRVTYFSKVFYAADVSFMSQISPTYEGNFARRPIGVEQSNLISNILAPGTLLTSVGFDWKPLDQVSIYVSPVAAKWIMVINDEVAQQFDYIDNNQPNAPISLHGTNIEFKVDDVGRIIPNDNGEATWLRFYNHDIQFGALARITYDDYFLNKRFLIKSQLSLYSDYLEPPERIDIDWVNEINFKFKKVKGLHISLWTNLFYDYDVPVQKTNWRQPGGVESFLSRTFSLSQQISIKYIKKFDKK